MKKYIAFSIAMIALASCKKDYTCQCNGTGGKVDVFTTKDTKKNAEEKCDAYYEANFGNVPMSETGCYIK